MYLLLYKKKIKKGRELIVPVKDKTCPKILGQEIIVSKQQWI